MSKNFKPEVGKVIPTKNPVVPNAISTKTPVVGDLGRARKKKWTFSFRYFDQMKFFGLGQTQPKWFVSLFDKLSELSKEDIDSFFRDRQLRESNRYHKINWDAHKIPIRKSDLKWVDSYYLNNDEDYPFFQFSISKGNGRIVGFWEVENECFYIVLLDHKHNLQPSKDYDYKVDDTSIIYNEYNSILADIDKVRSIRCVSEGCQCKEKLQAIPTHSNLGYSISFMLDEVYYNELKEKTKNQSIREIIELGLLKD